MKVETNVNRLKEVSEKLYETYLRNFDRHPETGDLCNEITLQDSENIVEFVLDQIGYNNEKEMVKRFNAICLESLDPETFEKWEDVKKVLYAIRKALR